MAVGVATRGQGKKHLGQGEHGQQHPDGGFAVALAQGQQGRSQAHAGHAGMQKDMASDQPEQLRVHKAPTLAAEAAALPPNGAFAPWDDPAPLTPLPSGFAVVTAFGGCG